MTSFGSDNPREMPAHFFYRSVRIHYDTAVRSDPAKQNCSICPRYWYVDAIFLCDRCGVEFVFSAAEQRVWYEDYGFWIDSVPRHCLMCRKDLRALKTVRQEYDKSVTHVLEHGDLESKKRLAGVIDQLCEFGGELPPRINENRRRLANQIARAESAA
jgi:Probable zinc-ribbon domain